MPWEKGQSGNPSGRRKESREEREAKALALKFVPEAINRLAELMRGDNPKVAATAAVAICDRGLGRPHQMTIVAGDEDNPLQVAGGLGVIYGVSPPAES